MLKFSNFAEVLTENGFKLLLKTFKIGLIVFYIVGTGTGFQ